jgi:hypothetical protein
MRNENRIRGINPLPAYVGAEFVIFVVSSIHTLRVWGLEVKRKNELLQAGCKPPGRRRVGRRAIYRPSGRSPR